MDHEPILSHSGIEISPKSFQIRLYDEKGVYTSSMQLNVDGDRGFIHSLAGPGAYAILSHHVRDLFTQTGIKILHGYMQEWHVEALKKHLGETLEIDDSERGTTCGRKMAWVKARLKNE